MKKRKRKKKIARFSKLAIKRHKLGDLERVLTTQEAKQYQRLTKKIAKSMKGW
jgi:hypothetical protein